MRVVIVAIVAHLAACGSCPGGCATQFQDVKVPLTPDEFSYTAITFCTNGACESGTFGLIGPDFEGANPLVLGPCTTIRMLTTGCAPATCTWLSYEPTMGGSCTWAALGDVLRLRIVNPTGDLAFDKSHTVGYQPDVCDAPCEKLDLTF